MHANALGNHTFTNKQNSTGRWEFLLLVIDHFHAPILLNPKLTNNDVVDTTGRVCPSVGFIISVEIKVRMHDTS